MREPLLYSRPLPRLETAYDVVVCGGGPAGCAAALAAVRRGARTLLLESQGQLGGTATSGLVSHWLGGRRDDCTTWVVGGIFRELSERAAASGIAVLPRQPEDGAPSPHGWGRGQLTAGVPFDPFAMAALLDDVTSEAGIDVLLLTGVADAVVDGDAIRSVIVCNKGGLQVVDGTLFIDATGDADLAARSGCRCLSGRGNDGLMAPATVEMHVEQVDLAVLDRYIREHDAPRFLREITAWREQGEWDFDVDRFISVLMDRPDVMMINTSRLCGVDGTDGRSLSAAMARGRHENLRLLEFMRRKLPGFAAARLKAMATAPGIRETRRIVGADALTVEDLRHGREFDDIIGYSAYGWDLPDPKKPSLQPMEQRGVAIADGLTPLPFRIMRPQPVVNLLCPGRAVGVERDVLGPVRVMAPCMAMGEAAGTAAALVCAAGRRDFNGVASDVLRQALRDAGAIVDRPRN